MKYAADGIGLLGFRKWYERRLIEAHVHLVTALFCLITVLAAIEMGGLFRNVVETLWVLSVVALLGGIGVWNWQRYIDVLGLAAFLCERSDCPACQAYGRFGIFGTAPRAVPDGSPEKRFSDVPLMRVRCRKYACEWSL